MFRKDENVIKKTNIVLGSIKDGLDRTINPTGQ